jgi:hypothetical protein
MTTPLLCKNCGDEITGDTDIGVPYIHVWWKLLNVPEEFGKNCLIASWIRHHDGEIPPVEMICAAEPEDDASLS